VPPGTVRGWKNKDNWNANLNGTERKRLERPKTPRDARRKMALSVTKNDELSDFEKNFCLHYIECYDLGAAAIRAGSTAKEPRKVGWALMQRPGVRDEIGRLKTIKAEAILAGPDDVVERMMRIAFADITDFVEFGRIEVPVMTAFGPLTITDPITDEIDHGNERG
jgi:phage terminase small subunit